MMGLRTAGDLVPRGERAFMMASDRLAMEDLAVPPKLSNFVKEEGTNG